MQREVLISIIVPVYNAESTIIRCLDSILNANYKKTEVIIINDGCTDHSKEILEGIVLNDNRVVLVNCDNNGVSCARNKGVALSKGEWICFIDSDDFISEDYFDIINNDVKGYDIIQIKNISFYPKQENVNFFKRNQTFPASGIYALREKFSMYVWGKLYRKDVIHTNFFSNELTIGEDYLYNCQVFKTANIFYTEIGTYNYAINPNSLSRGDSNGDKIWERLKSANKMYNYFEKNEPKLASYIYTTYGLIGTLRAYPRLKWIIFILKKYDVNEIARISFWAIWKSNCNMKAKIISSLVLGILQMVRK